MTVVLEERSNRIITYPLPLAINSIKQSRKEFQCKLQAWLFLSHSALTLHGTGGDPSQSELAKTKTMNRLLLLDINYFRKSNILHIKRNTAFCFAPSAPKSPMFKELNYKFSHCFSCDTLPLCLPALPSSGENNNNNKKSLFFFSFPVFLIL